MKISVIIPCFNQGKYLAETLDSVVMQTFSDWECIIIMMVRLIILKTWLYPMWKRTLVFIIYVKKIKEYV